jgi:hypothetical protein
MIDEIDEKIPYLLGILKIGKPLSWLSGIPTASGEILREGMHP